MTALEGTADTSKKPLSSPELAGYDVIKYFYLPMAMLL